MSPLYWLCVSRYRSYVDVCYVLSVSLEGRTTCDKCAHVSKSHVTATCLSNSSYDVVCITFVSCVRLDTRARPRHCTSSCCCDSTRTFHYDVTVHSIYNVFLLPASDSESVEARAYGAYTAHYDDDKTSKHFEFRSLRGRDEILSRGILFYSNYTRARIK